MDSGEEQVKFQQQEKPHFNQALVPLQAFIPKADELKDGWGITDLYSTGCSELDDYLGGGYGRKNGGYEIVLIFGNPGQGKSALGLNMMLDPIAKGVNVGLMILEDDPADVVNRLRLMTGGTIDSRHNVFFLAEQTEGYTLPQALNAIEQWFKACDVVLLDHLEYLWAGAMGQSERDKFTQQEIWMRRLNTLMKKTGKTIVMIQHTNKTKEEGMERIKGSSSLQQTATKVIEFNRNQEGCTMLRLWKTRFTPYRHESLQIRLNNFLIEAV